MSAADDDPTLEHPLVAAVRAVASLADQRDLLAYLLYVAVYEMHPTHERVGLHNAPLGTDEQPPYPCGFNFPHPIDGTAMNAMHVIIAEQWRKAKDRGHDFIEHGAELLARWEKANEQ